MAKRQIFGRADQVRIILDKSFCPRCRQVAAKELLATLKLRDNSNPGAAVEAFKIEDDQEQNGKANHTFVPGKCHGSKEWPF